jgi:hypothetical protein
MRVGPMTPTEPTIWPSTVVGGGDHAAFVERGEARFAADEDLDAGGAVGDVEQLHQAGALFEQVEQFAQATHVGREFLDIEQVVFAGLMTYGVPRFGQGFAAGSPAPADISGWISSRSCCEFRRQPVADLFEVEAGEILVQIVGRIDQFGGRIRRSVTSIRFCTSPSVVTMISRMRFSVRLRNSIWRMRLA